jgi:bifunctional DNase/RNase
MTEKKELAIVALSSSESQPGNYVVILEDLDQQRRIPIIIGMPEAQSIAIAMEQMQPARPLTHDLLKNVIEVLGGVLKEVVIHELSEGVFHARLVLQKNDGTLLEADSRASDAIALAVRCGVPVYSFENVILEAGILSDSLAGRQTGGSLAQYSLAELEDLLVKVIEKEDYESASKIKDYIDKRKET